MLVGLVRLVRSFSSLVCLLASWSASVVRSTVNSVGWWGGMSSGVSLIPSFVGLTS